MDTTYSTRVAAAVRAAMTQSGKSANRLATETGMSRQALARRLNGPAPFTVGELAVIAAALDVSVYSLAAPEVAA